MTYPIKFPKYVLALIEEKRIAPASIDEQSENMDFYGYTFRLYRKSNMHHSHTHIEEAERLVKWAKREAAEARVVRSVWFTDKEHRKPYWKRDYVLLVISDPVAIQIEKLIKAQKGVSHV